MRLWWGCVMSSPTSPAAGGGFAAIAAAAEECDAVLRFVAVALRDGAAGGDLGPGGEVHWDQLFSPAALRLLCRGDDDGGTVAQARSAVSDQVRRELVAGVLRQGADLRRDLDVARQLADALSVADCGVVRAEGALRLLFEGDDAAAAEMFAEAGAGGRPDPSGEAVAVTRVVRLRVKHLVAALAAGGSQRRQERSLNLLAAMPHDLMVWAQDAAPEHEEELVRQWAARLPAPAAAARLRALAARAVADPPMPGAGAGDEVAERLREAHAFASHLCRHLIA